MQLKLFHFLGPWLFNSPPPSISFSPQRGESILPVSHCVSYASRDPDLVPYLVLGQDLSLFLSKVGCPRVT